jgi:arginyl-tRNA synthetase
LKKKILIQKADKSIWIDLTAEGLDEKILLRTDGTSVYITQDLGTAKLRQDEYNPEKLIYVVGNEQNYHFDVLKLILKKLGYEWSEKIYHLSYGMVELPEGKMKSREGTVVDADELMNEMFDTARQMTEELGKIEDFNSKEAEDLYRKVSLGALKYFILKVDPAKNMMFNPKESIDFNGNTGPFVQYTYARVQSMIRKSGYKESDKNTFAEINLHPKEKEIIKMLYDFPETIRLAGEKYSPAFIANYAYELAKEFNQYYHEVPIIKEADKNLSAFRIELAYFTGQILKNAFALLGIEMPDKM